MTSRKAVIIPARAAYEVTRCFDCPYFKEYGARYQDGNTCQHDSVDYPLVSGYEIPDWCPELKEIPVVTTLNRQAVWPFR